jgi:hypothetical protein
MSEKEQRSASIGIRVKPSLKLELEKLAQSDRRTLANYVEVMLEAHVAKKRQMKKNL